ncbi:MAG: hypothetical protein BAJALOKI1v1_1560005 [Promethearchaeota archaeon]|nr:MAG: hypothetical protein BAJALOKI1v1_1560005 [Candidatus Lokiarchaeota archaeon]
MSDEFDEDDKYDDFIDKIKERFNIDSDIFDAEFYIFPSKDLGKRFGIDSEEKGFKISYHYEKGMDKPDIKIHGNFDKDKLEDYLKRMKFIGKNNPNFKTLFQPNKKMHQVKKPIDATELSLNMPQEVSTENRNKHQEKLSSEPSVEIRESEEQVEIILEAPGIRENEIFISLDEESNTLKFNAENEKRRYNKSIPLSCQVSVLNDTLAANNGIISFICQKK